MLRLMLCLALALPSSAAIADTLLVANKHDNTVSFVDLDTGVEVVRAPTGRSPHELALSPDGRMAAVVSYLENDYVGQSLNLFDVATARLDRTISIAPHAAPHGIAWIGDTDSVIVTTEDTNDVIMVDVIRGKVTQSVPTDAEGSHLLALTPDSRIAYVTNRGSDTVSAVDVDAMAVMATVPAGASPEAVAVSPTDGSVWVGNRDDDTIMVFSPDMSERVATLDVGYLPIRVAFAPDGVSVATVDLTNDRVVVYDPVTLAETASVDLRAAGLSQLASLLFSEDGAFAYTGGEGSGSVAEIDTATWTVSRVFQVAPGADGLAISPVTVSPLS